MKYYLNLVGYLQFLFASFSYCFLHFFSPIRAVLCAMNIVPTSNYCSWKFSLNCAECFGSFVSSAALLLLFSSFSVQCRCWLCNWRWHRVDKTQNFDYHAADRTNTYTHTRTLTMSRITQRAEWIYAQCSRQKSVIFFALYLQMIILFLLNCKRLNWYDI